MLKQQEAKEAKPILLPVAAESEKLFTDITDSNNLPYQHKENKFI